MQMFAISVTSNCHNLITGEPSQSHLKVLPSISSKIENSCMILNSDCISYSTAAVCLTAYFKSHIAK